MSPVRRAPDRRTRAVRVPTPGVRARVNSTRGDVLNLSATGALLRVFGELHVGSEGPVTLDLDSRRIELAGRIVRCERQTIELPGGAMLKQPEYTVGVMFIRPSADAMQGIAQLCGGAVATEELPFRILLVGDDTAMNGAIGRTLSGAGYQLRVIADAREALAAAKAFCPDATVVELRPRRDPPAWWLFDVLASNADTSGILLVAIAEPSSLQPDCRRYLDDRHVLLVPRSSVPESLLPLLARTLGVARREGR